MKKEIKQIAAVAGAIISFLVGSGFSTGQEQMQFYVSNGVIGCIGSLIISSVLLTWVTIIVIEDGHNLQLSNANSIWKYYCGKVFGKAIEIFTVIFLFLLLVMMISGAGAALNQTYNAIQPIVGRVLIATLALSTVFLGISKLTKVLGVIGIAIIVLCVTVALVGIFQNIDQLRMADEILAGKDVLRASPFWWLSGLLYPAFTIVLLAPFLAGVGQEVSSQRDARRSGAIGITVFSIVASMVAIALLSTIEHTATANAPTQAMAAQIGNLFGIFYCVLLILAIFSTSVSLLWMICNSMFYDEKSLGFRLTGVAVAVCAFFLSVFPFKVIVNVILPNTGYLGIFVIVCVFYKRYFRKENAKVKISEMQ